MVRYLINRLAVTILYLLLIISGAVEAFALKVVDGIDSSQLCGATVLSHSGNILGITDSSGGFSGARESDYPLTVRCVGYAPGVCLKGMEDVRMQPVSYTLGEVTVTPADGSVVRTLCYVREIQTFYTDKDTLLRYSESMADLYQTVGKVKGLKAGKDALRMIDKKTYVRFDSKDATPEFREEMKALDLPVSAMATLPSGEISESDGIRSGSKVVSIMGKHYVQTIERKSGDVYVRDMDMLADKKDHRMSPAIFKLLGITTDFNEMRRVVAFRGNEEGVYGAEDMMYCVFNVGLLAKGKLLRKMLKSGDSPIEINIYLEIYPVEREAMSVEEANGMWQSPSRSGEIRCPEYAMPLPAAIEDLVVSGE